MSITLLGAGEMKTNEIVVNAKYFKAFLKPYMALLLKNITPNLVEFMCISFQYYYGYSLGLINQSGKNTI